MAEACIGMELDEYVVRRVDEVAQSLLSQFGHKNGQIIWDATRQQTMQDVQRTMVKTDAELGCLIGKHLVQSVLS